MIPKGRVSTGQARLALFLLALAVAAPARAVAQTAAPAAAAPAPALAPISDVAEKVDAYLQAQAKVNGFSGTVLVSRGGSAVLSKGYGWANAEWQVPNTPATKFRLGSITKQFTAAVVLRLQETKRLSVQDPICTYVSPCPDAWKAVTVHHLLTHTSGIPTMITRVPSNNVAVIVLGNVDNINAGNIARDLMAITYSLPYQMLRVRTTVTVTPDVLAQYVGRYQIGPDFILTVTLEDGKLMTQATGQSKVEVFAESETTFFLKVVDAQLTFGRDEAGRVAHVTLHQNGRDQKATKIE